MHVDKNCRKCPWFVEWQREHAEQELKAPSPTPMIIWGVCWCRVMIMDARGTSVSKRSQRNSPIRHLTQGRERLLYLHTARVARIVRHGMCSRVTGPRNHCAVREHGRKRDTGMMRAGRSRMNSIRHRRRRICVIRERRRLWRLVITQETLP